MHSRAELRALRWQRRPRCVSRRWKAGKRRQPRDHELRGKWWEAYNDPLLNELMEQVSVSNQNLAQAAAQFRQATGAGRDLRARPICRPSRLARRLPARKLFLPGLSSTASAGRDCGADRRTNLQALARRRLGTRRVGPRASRRWNRTKPVRRRAQPISRPLRLSVQAELAQNYFQLRALDAEKAAFRRTPSPRTSVRCTHAECSTPRASSPQVDVIQAQTQLKTHAGTGARHRRTARATRTRHRPAARQGRRQFSRWPAPLTALPPAIPVGIPSEPPRAAPRHRCGRTAHGGGECADRRRRSRLLSVASLCPPRAVSRAPASPSG